MSWVITTGDPVSGNLCFGETHCLHPQNKLNVGNTLPKFAVSNSIKQWSEQVFELFYENYDINLCVCINSTFEEQRTKCDIFLVQKNVSHYIISYHSEEYYCCIANIVVIRKVSGDSYLLYPSITKEIPVAARKVYWKNYIRTFQNVRNTGIVIYQRRLKKGGGVCMTIHTVLSLSN
jgi:hypothetical protein